jgi:hypothetical protein
MSEVCRLPAGHQLCREGRRILTSSRLHKHTMVAMLPLHPSVNVWPFDLSQHPLDARRAGQSDFARADQTRVEDRPSPASSDRISFQRLDDIAGEIGRVLADGFAHLGKSAASADYSPWANTSTVTPCEGLGMGMQAFRASRKEVSV